jgi:hypothetical protein
LTPCRAAAAIFAATLLPACGDGTGVVEMSWVFVDRDGDPIFPAGALSVGARRDSCDFAGTRSGGTVAIDLRLQLEICDPTCAAGCDDASCRIVDPLRFPCDASRASDPNIPASEDPYRFTVRAVIESASADIECVDPDPSCMAVPGPRDRSVADGLVTDLQVYQIVVDINQAEGAQALDLEACGCA